MHSISKLTSQTDLDRVELEFIKIKETEGFQQKYPNLYKEKFGFGMKLVLSSIVNEIRKGKFAGNVDIVKLTQHVFDQCKDVSE